MTRIGEIAVAIIASLALMTLIISCGAGNQRQNTTTNSVTAVKMRHQILFSRPDEQHVFEGYMIFTGEALLVKAFAGPGVDLFTVVREGAHRFEELHIPALADKIDITAVAADIARAYLGGCEGSYTGGETSCDFFGEPMIETYDQTGHRARRRFPKAHGIGLLIEYKDFKEFSGQDRASRITLVWGESPNRMVILLVALENLDSVDPAVFQRVRAR